MKLISCDNCGVVLDADKLNFSPEHEKHKEDGSIDEDKFTWDGDDYVAFVICPTCREAITKE